MRYTQKRSNIFILGLVLIFLSLIIFSGCELAIPDLSASWSDVHGAGCQRSDPKSGSLSDYGSAGAGYYNTLAPQGDAVRIFNYVRPVRDEGSAGSFKIVDTGQTTFFNNSAEMGSNPTSSGDSFYGQDAQFSGNQPSYTVSGDGKTVSDNVTGLVWMKGPNSDLSAPLASDKMSRTGANAYVISMNAASYGGYSDWRLPSLKELYSLIIFSGIDPSGYEDSDISGLVPFIDTDAFNFAFGETDAGERIVDSQYLTTNTYVSTASGTLYFGVNFADGRIKGYGSTLNGVDKTFFVQLVRENTSYGSNSFTNNGDGTITDSATGLMWGQADSGEGMNWEDALSWIQTKNNENYLGHSDWRLPNGKEMQSIVDYSHAPDYDGKPAIDTTYFSCTSITNEMSEADFPWYWTGTTHQSWESSGSGSAAVYIPFGRATGYSSETP